MYCIELNSINVDNLNTTNVLNFGSLASNCNNLNHALNVDTGNAISLNSAYASVVTAKYLDLSSYITTNVNIFNSLFGGCTSLIRANLSSMDMSRGTSLANFNVNCYALEEIDLSHTTLAACTDNTNILLNTLSLIKVRVPQIGRTFSLANNKLDTAACDQVLTDLRDLNGSISTSTLNAAGTGYAVGDEVNITAGNNDAILKVLTIAAGGAVASYLLKVAGTGYTVVNGLSTSNISGTGSGLKVNVTALVATQTLTLTGNPGAATCNAAIGTAKNWIIVI